MEAWYIPCNLPISESSDSLSPEVVMPTAPATELEANEEHKINGISKSCSLHTYKLRNLPSKVVNENL